MTMTCDIIMPAYNSAGTIPLALRALFKQTVPDGWQVRVIVSDDGSRDETVAITRRLLATVRGWDGLVVTGPHAGAAAARNRALDQSTASVVLFIQADIVLRPDALAAHLEFHETHSAQTAGALGWVMWDPCLKPTALMEWMTHGGPQNDYDALLTTSEADPRHYFYAANVSLKRSLLSDIRFASTFTEYGWEDLDFGRQLADRGLTLRVLPQACGLHHHYYTVDDVRRRQYASGQGLVHYQQRHPSVMLLPPRRWDRRCRFWLYRLSGGSFVVRWLVGRYPQIVWPRLFSLLSREAFWSGIYGSNK